MSPSSSSQPRPCSLLIVSPTPTKFGRNSSRTRSIGTPVKRCTSQMTRSPRSIIRLLAAKVSYSRPESQWYAHVGWWPRRIFWRPRCGCHHWEGVIGVIGQGQWRPNYHQRWIVCLCGCPHQSQRSALSSGWQPPQQSQPRGLSFALRQKHLPPLQNWMHAHPWQLFLSWIKMLMNAQRYRKVVCDCLGPLL